MKIRSLTAVCLLLSCVTSPSAAQQVEYVTRGVQPTHAVRFNANPIRVTLTDRGARSLPLPSATTTRPHRPRIFIGGGRRIVIGHPVIRIEQPRIEVDARPRTVYGADRPNRVDRSRSATESAADSAPDEAAASRLSADEAERRRLALHARALLRAERRAAERSAR